MIQPFMRNNNSGVQINSPRNPVHTDVDDLINQEKKMETMFHADQPKSNQGFVFSPDVDLYDP